MSPAFDLFTGNELMMARLDRSDAPGVAAPHPLAMARTHSVLAPRTSSRGPSSRACTSGKPGASRSTGVGAASAAIVRVLAGLGLVALCFTPVWSGTVKGRVIDKATGKPLAFTNVMVTGTALGAISGEDGSFTILNVPAGTHTLQASYLGYETAKSALAVPETGEATVAFTLSPTVAKKEKEVVITAERPLVEVERANTSRSFNSDELKNLTIQPTLDSVVEQQPGVTRDNGQIHIRGGRAEETLFIVDGVQMRDVLSGDSEGKNVSARSVAEVNIITGGFDAKYGQALSGIVEARIKEGGQQYEGYVGVQSDDLLTDWNTRLIDFQIGGPLPLFDRLLEPIGGETQQRPTFFMNLAADLTDGYLPSLRDLKGDYHLQSNYQDRILGRSFEYGRFFTPAAANDWRFLLKSAWKASTNHKFVVSATKTLSIDQGFNDSDIAEVNRNRINYPWSWSRSLQRYTTVTHDQNSFVLSWTHTARSNLFHTLKATRFFSSRHNSVDGKLWDEIPVGAFEEEILTPSYFVGERLASSFRTRATRTLALDWDWQLKTQRHDVQWGARGQYEDVLYLSLDARSIDPQSAPLGDEFDLFHVFPTTGAFYAQDRVAYEDLLVGYGLRYDYWFPGKQVERLFEKLDRPAFNEGTKREWMEDTHGLFGRRFKGHFSPRILVSHPITERDHLFFNYGHFTQRPPYYYVYSKTSSLSSEEFPNIGNPNLNPEVSVQYELGAGHQFRSDMAIKTTVFYKDIYDYPTSTTIILQDRTTSRSNFFVYRNLDYARSRGVELELKRRRSGRTSWSVGYTYSVVKGKSSDPNKLKLVQGLGGDARETSLDEEYMWWNRPHKLSVWWDYRIAPGDREAKLFGRSLPQDLGLNLFYQYQSGRTYTPTDIFGNQTGADYSKNGPHEGLLNGTLRKGYDINGRHLELTLQGWNLFNHRHYLVVDPATGERYVPGVGSLVGRTDAITVDRYSDPSQRAEPRHFRLGVGMEF